MNYDEIERMKQENKDMRLELQRLRNQAMMMSDINGSQNGASTSSPKSFDGRTISTKDHLIVK